MKILKWSIICVLGFLMTSCTTKIDLTKEFIEEQPERKKIEKNLDKDEITDIDSFQQACGESLQNSYEQTENDNLENVNISFYVDGTLSMRGYVDPTVQTSRYAKTLRLLNEVAAQEVRASGLRYYKFGLESKLITEQEYSSAFEERFYMTNNEDDENFQVAKIDSAITTPSENSLSVIITDLYQKGTDLSNIKEKLNKDYIQTGYAVGILAVKSEFNGLIYDVGIQNTSFEYTTKGKDIEAYRPFYVVVLGKQSHIKAYFNKLQEQNGSDFLKESHFLVFSSDIVEKNSSFYGGYNANYGKGKGRRPTNISNGKISVKTGDLPIEKLNANLFKLKTNNNRETDDNNNSNKNVKKDLIYTVPYYPSEYHLKMNTNEDSLIIQKEIKRFDGSDSQSLETALNLENWTFIDNYDFGDNKTALGISFITKVNPNDFNNGVYGYIFNLKPQKLEEQEWWLEWNSDDNMRDGSKTNGIIRLLRGLKSGVEENLPDIARFCYIVQKK